MQIFFHSKNLFALLQSYYSSLQNETEDIYYMINDLRTKYCQYANIDITDQCDSALFLNWLLDLLQNNKDKLEWLSYIACKKCKKISKKHYKEHLWIVYPYEDDDSEIKELTLPLILRKQNNQTIEFKCEKCNIVTPHLQKFFVINEPKNIFFNFQQTLSDHNKEIKLDENINLGVKKSPAEYKLKGVVLHRRDSDESGHYTILIEESSGEWCHYNDATITKVLDPVLRKSRLCKKYTHPIVWYERVD